MLNWVTLKAEVDRERLYLPSEQYIKENENVIAASQISPQNILW